MNIDTLLETLSSANLDVPADAPIYELRRHTIDDLQRRLRKVLPAIGETCDRRFDGGAWSSFDDRTLVKLAGGAHAVAYHASGAIRFASGVPPLEQLIGRSEDKEALQRRAHALFERLALADALGRRETIAFERLWQVKAGAADRDGRTVEPVVCRAIAAYRHHIDGVPVLGPASVAVQIAAGDTLDALSLNLRQPAAEPRETAKLLHPERAIRQIGQQLAARFAAAGDRVRIESRTALQFGYLSLSKRKAQRLLAPVYVAVLDVHHEFERQGLVLVTAATEQEYLPLNPAGTEAPVLQTGKMALRRCC